ALQISLLPPFHICWDASFSHKVPASLNRQFCNYSVTGKRRTDSQNSINRCFLCSWLRQLTTSPKSNLPAKREADKSPFYKLKGFSVAPTKTVGYECAFVPVRVVSPIKAKKKKTPGSRPGQAPPSLSFGGRSAGSPACRSAGFLTCGRWEY